MDVIIQSPPNITELANYIALQNREPCNHIGYCGQKAAEIKDTMLNDFGDVAISDAFVTAYKSDQIVGAFGLDVDASRNIAEAWGPFVSMTKEWQSIANRLWNKLISTMHIHNIDFFINKENKQAQIFLD